MRKKKALLVAGGFAVLAAFLYFRLNATMPELRTADIVFQTGVSSQSAAIMLASRSLINHTGIVERQKDGSYMVIETFPPRNKRPLQEWIDDGVWSRVEIARVKDLTEEGARKIVAWAKRHEGKPYDIYFLEDDRAFYCSELVHDAFKNGADIELGQKQKVGDLDLDYAPVRKVVEERWRSYPLCVEKGLKTFEACYALIHEQTLVTPVSVMDDDRLETIYSNYIF